MKKLSMGKQVSSKVGCFAEGGKVEGTAGQYVRGENSVERMRVADQAQLNAFKNAGDAIPERDDEKYERNREAAKRLGRAGDREAYAAIYGRN